MCLISKSNLNVTSKSKFSLEDNILPLIKKIEYMHIQNFSTILEQNDFLKAKIKLIKYLSKTSYIF